MSHFFHWSPRVTEFVENGLFIVTPISAPPFILHMWREQLCTSLTWNGSGLAFRTHKVAGTLPWRDVSSLTEDDEDAYLVIEGGPAYGPNLVDGPESFRIKIPTRLGGRYVDNAATTYNRTELLALLERARSAAGIAVRSALPPIPAGRTVPKWPLIVWIAITVPAVWLMIRGQDIPFHWDDLGG